MPKKRNVSPLLVKKNTTPTPTPPYPINDYKKTYIPNFATAIKIQIKIFYLGRERSVI